MTRIDDLKRLALQGDEESQYQLAVEYLGIGDTPHAIEWLEKISLVSSHSRYGKSISYLAQFHEDGVYPGFSEEQNRAEAVRLFMMIVGDPNSVISRLHLGLLYCEGIGVKHNPSEGKRLIEESIHQLINEDNNDSYLSAYECSRIGSVYCDGLINIDKNPSISDLEEAKKYFEKAINRWKDKYDSERKRMNLDKILLAKVNKKLDDAAKK